MRHIKMLQISLFILFLFISNTIYSFDKPAVIVLTDIGGDPDDEQSLVRFLLYSDMFAVKAICATSRLGHGQDIKPEIIRKQIEAYGKVHANLILHSKDYPSTDYLLSIIKEGQGNHRDFGDGFDSQASDFMIQVVDDSPNTVHIIIWGGQRELAQTLWKVQNTRNEEEVIKFCKKIQVHAIGDQDKHRDWIINNFKDIRYLANAYIYPGNFGIPEVAVFRGMYMTGNTDMQNGEWVRTNIHGHGPLSECYPADAHGTDGMKEGDTPSFLGLITNGLNFPEKPEWGGWGGRFRPLSSSNLLIDASDILDGKLNERHTVSRWRLAFQSDFTARLDRCIKPVSQVNRPPLIIINGNSGLDPLFIEAKTGTHLVFDASETKDPDNDGIEFNWFFYEELSFPGCVDFQLSNNAEICSFTVPEQMKGRTHHLILEVSDHGMPCLKGYKRMIINVI